MATARFESTSTTMARLRSWTPVLTFRRMVSLTMNRSPNDREPSPCYEYIKQQYGIVFRVGDRVKITEPGEDFGKHGRVLLKKQRFHYVGVEVEGSLERGEWHPESVEVVVPAVK